VALGRIADATGHVDQDPMREIVHRVFPGTKRYPSDAHGYQYDKENEREYKLLPQRRSAHGHLHNAIRPKITHHCLRAMHYSCAMIGLVVFACD
jgi:hypothetical protein